MEAGAGVVPPMLTMVEAQEVVLHVPTAATKYVVVEPGETEREDPVPTSVPPQLPEYQVQLAPTPKDPPDTVRVVGLPGQIGFGLALALAAAEDAVANVTGKQVGALVPHKLLAVTQIFPALPGVALMEVVPCPELMVHPAGTVQL
jgi:hypothetical protein